ncbi:Ankyrin repeats (3 copies) [Popillia japonica]|uniref:Ankyrin repeats (3 copies) n=1 Tax=Popillia japonica TaxID=7064 RepID=A0AAW1HRW5_POPJA
MKKRNIVFPLKKFKNIFSWALSSLPIESIETACEDEETIRLLLENGADPKHVPEELITINENDHTFSCRKTAVKHILENTRNVSTDLPNNPKTKIDVNTSTPLHDAVLAQNIILLKNLVTDGTVDINKQDRDGRTALKLAAIKGHQNIVGCLLQSGADANIQNGATDETALHCAAGNGCITISNTNSIKLAVREAMPTSSKLVKYTRDSVMVEMEKLLVQWIEDNNKKHIGMDTRIIHSVMVKMEKLLVQWIEDNNKKHIGMDTRIIQSKALSIFSG